MVAVNYFLELQTKTGWARVLSRFVDWIAPQTGWQTLDIGCGPGMLPALLAARDCHAFGVDLNPSIFSPQSLHADVAAADTICLPFPAGSFHLVTASNLLFLLSEPQRALGEMRRVLRRPGQIAILNPSENLNVQAATLLADSRNLHGLARDSLLNWAARAEAHSRWTELELDGMFRSVGLHLVATRLTVGPGFALFARAN